MAVTNLGKVSVTPKGAWSSSFAYEFLDIVTNGGSSYLAVQAVPAGTALSNTTYWLVIASKGDKGDTGETGPKGDTGDTGNGVASIEKTSTSGLVDTYTVTMTDGTTTTFTVTNASSGVWGSISGNIEDQTDLAGTLAPTFDTTTAYNVGDYCFYQGALYRFVTAKSAGAWDASCVESAVITEDMKSSLASKATAITETASGSIVTIDDGADGVPVENLKVSIEPVQDLHGYDAPWPAGGGKNLLPMTLANMKVINTAGTWNENVYTLYGVTFTIATDNGGNIESITVNGTATNFSLLRLVNGFEATADMIMNGCPSGGSYSEGYRLEATANAGHTTRQDIGHGIAINSGDSFSRVIIAVANGSTSSGAVFYPMIRLATENDATFAPYSNICPISGFDSVKVTRTGKNLLNIINQSTTTNGVTFTVNADKSISISGVATGNAFFNLDFRTSLLNAVCDVRKYVGKNLVISLADSENSSVVITSGYFKSDGTFSSSGATSTRKEFQYPSDAYKARTYIQVVRGTDLSTPVTVYPMIRLADTDDSFEPYSGQTLDITIPTEAGTVYGATLTVNPDRTGSLVVDRAMVDLGTLTWTVNQSTAHAFNYWLNTRKAYNLFSEINKKNICSSYTFYDSNVLAQKSSGISYSQNLTNKTVYIKDDNCTTVAEITAALSGVQLVYELGTPLTYQLTPQELTTLLGTNNIWADSGDTEITYRADTKLFIQNAIAESQTATRSLIAGVETSATATKNYTTSDLLIVGDKLYKVTANIASGGAITEGTNVTATTVAEQLLALASA